MQIVDHLTGEGVPPGASWACLGYRMHEFSSLVAQGGVHFFGPMYPTEAAAYNAAVDHATQQQIYLLYWVGGRGEAIETACATSQV